MALGGPTAPGLVFLPCELIEANGATLRRIVLVHAAAGGSSAAFVDWIESQNRFLDTLVDRIVPGYPAAEAEALFAEWGYRRPLAVAAEPFHLWVIQGPQEIAAELPLAEAGLNVIGPTISSPTATARCASSTARTRRPRLPPTSPGSTPSSR